MRSAGEIVRKARKERGSSQGDLGRELNVSQRTISTWERNESPIPLSRVHTIARVLDLDPDDTRALTEAAEASGQRGRDTTEALAWKRLEELERRHSATLAVVAELEHKVGQSSDPGAPLVFTLEQAAEVLQCSLEHLQTLVAQREVPHVRLGTLLTRIPRDALAAWLDREANRSVEWPALRDRHAFAGNGTAVREVWIEEESPCNEPS
jgi:excisionase family DNA binding protein